MRTPTRRWSLPILITTLFLLCLIVVMATAASKKEEDKEGCEYDVDLNTNVIKIICKGSTSRVNVYADTAHVSGEEQTGSQPGTNNNNNNGNSNNNHKTNNGGSKNDKAKGSSRSKGQTDTRRPTHPRGGVNGRKGDKKEDMTSSSQQSDQWMPWDMPHPTGVFSNMVWNATQKLDDAKKKLSSYASFIRNISRKLEAGDATLQADMDTLRVVSNSASVLKECIIAAMTNQFNFMRSALLTRNNEVDRLVTTLKVLVDVTSHGLQGALAAHKEAMNQVSHANKTMAAIRRMIGREFRRRRRSKGAEKPNNKQKACPKEISAFGAGRSRTVKGIPVGSFMVESLNPNEPGKVWIMSGSEESEELLEFDLEIDIYEELVARFIPLPFQCIGTGHAIFRRHFYCHEKSSNRIAKYHLKKMDIIGEIELPGVSITSNKYPYQSGQNTDVDLAVDELGLWAIYATDESRGNVVISKLNHQQMEVERTWVTNYQKRRLGNAFMVCGVLYATDSSSDAPTFIRYSYDTASRQDRKWEAGKLPFANSATPTTTNIAKTDMQGVNSRKQTVNSVMLSYDFRTSTLFSWNNGKIEKFSVYFKDREP